MRVLTGSARACCGAIHLRELSPYSVLTRAPSARSLSSSARTHTTERGVQTAPSVPSAPHLALDARVPSRGTARGRRFRCSVPCAAHASGAHAILQPYRESWWRRCVRALPRCRRGRALGRALSARPPGNPAHSLPLSSHLQCCDTTLSHVCIHLSRDIDKNMQRVSKKPAFELHTTDARSPAPP